MCIVCNWVNEGWEFLHTRQTVTKLWNHGCCRDWFVRNSSQCLKFNIGYSLCFSRCLRRRPFMDPWSLRMWWWILPWIPLECSPGVFGSMSKRSWWRLQSGCWLSWAYWFQASRNLHTSRFDGIEATTETDIHIFVVRIVYYHSPQVGFPLHHCDFLFT